MRSKSRESGSQCVVRPADWNDPDDQARLMEVRNKVFVVEQKVPSEIEIDAMDCRCLHVLAQTGEEGKPIGTARLDEEGHVGRVAVLRSWRRRGIGTALMRRLIDVARSRGRPHLELNSQVTAVAFYESLGFAVDRSTPEFLEAGIPHLRMTLIL